jgi:trigger factor
LVRVEVEIEKVAAAFEEITKDFQKHAKLPGFRPGKATKEMIAKRFENDILEETKRKVISDSYKEAIAEKKFKVVVAPDIEEIQFGKGQSCQFTATIETAPEFELPEYKGIPVVRDSSVVTDADVTRALDMLRERRAEYPVVARELANGDMAVVNYTGTCDGKPLTDLAPTARGLTQQQGFWIAMQTGSFIPGFSEQLLGAKAGDKRTVNVDFPQDFVTPQLAGLKGVYEVEVVETREKKLPELNDELAKAYEAESLDKLREGVRADLQNELNAKQSRSIRNQVVQTLLNKVQCELPETVVHEETRSIVYNIVLENQHRGVPKEAIDAQKDEIYKSASASAKDRVKANFIISRIAEQEGVRVEQMDVANRLQVMAAQYKMPVEKLIKDLGKNDGIQEVYHQLVNEKVVDLLVQNAKMEDAPASAAPQQPA